jgi:hypothetical protein
LVAVLVGLFAPKVGFAVQIDVLSQVIGVDTVARVLNPIDPARVPDDINDPAPKFGSAPTQSAQAMLLDTAFTNPDTQQLSVRFGQAEAVATNLGVDLQPTSYLFNASAVIGGNGDPYFDESAEAQAFGQILFQISEDGVGPGTEAFVEVGFSEASLSPRLGVGSASFVVRNLTLGTILFDSSTGGFPVATQVLGARVGDQLQMDWMLGISGSIPDSSARGEVGLEGRLEVIALGEPVSTPEPSVILLLLGLVPVAVAARRARNRN